MVNQNQRAIPFATAATVNDPAGSIVKTFPDPTAPMDFKAMPLSELIALDQVTRLAVANTEIDSIANALGIVLQRQCQLEIVRRYRVHRAIEEFGLPCFLRRQAN